MAPAPRVPNTGKVPPDGGWGWVVAGAFAINNVIVIPILQNFGLIFKDKFKEMGISATDITLIMNVNNSFGLALGLFYGALLRKFGYRKIAVIGSLTGFLGIGLTATAQTFWQFLLFYGAIMSAGATLNMAAFSFAMNSYFRKKRGMAMGFSMTLTGLGPIFMPHLMSFFMKEYGVAATAQLLAALSLHSLIGACLLQPIKWHMIDPDPEPEKEPGKNGKKVDTKPEEKVAKEPEVLAPMLEEDEDDLEIEDTPREKSGSVSLVRRVSNYSQRSHVCLDRAISEDNSATGANYWASVGSLHSIELANSSMQLDRLGLETRPKPTCSNGKCHRNSATNGKALTTTVPEKVPLQTQVDTPVKPKKTRTKRWLLAIVNFFDLTLLRDPIYVNLMLGMSFAIFAEINFSLTTPLILDDRGFVTSEIATFMSVNAITDIVFRFLAPFIGKLLKLSSRVMYMSSLFVLILTRTLLIFSKSYTMVMLVMALLGIAKGLRTVFWGMVIPDYVPIERLPAASGIQSVVNAAIFMGLGPFVGLIRDWTGNYDYSIVTINSLTFLTILMWSTEFAIVAVRRKRREAAGEATKA